MTAAWANIRVRQGKRWQSEVEDLGLDAEQAQSVEGKVAAHFIECRDQFGLLQLDVEAPAGWQASPLKVLALRMQDTPDLVFMLALRSGEIDPEDVEEFRKLFADKL